MNGLKRPGPRAALLLAAVATTALLGGCWDDDDDLPVPAGTAQPNAVPDSALTSIAAYTAYVGSLPASDTAAPVDVGNVTDPPTSETAAPQTL